MRNFDDYTELENMIVDILWNFDKKKPEPKDKLLFAGRLYFKYKDQQENLIDLFLSIFETCLYSILANTYDFYDLEDYIKEFDWEIRDFKEDNIDATDIDCINRQIDIHESVLDKSFKYFLDLGEGNTIELISLLEIDFLDLFKYSSQKKLDFLMKKKALFEGDASTIENPYPNNFKNGLVYQCFIKYVKEHIVDESHRDWSYLKKRLEKQKFIKKISDPEFNEFIHKELKLISNNTYKDFDIKHKFLSLNNASKPQREHNFNVVFSKLLNQ
jgi:hypothetical protein